MGMGSKRRVITVECEMVGWGWLLFSGSVRVLLFRQIMLGMVSAVSTIWPV